MDGEKENNNAGYESEDPDTDAHHVTVRAPPRNPDSGELDTPERVYEVLDGHHRVAALRALQARNLIPREYALPVTVLQDALPETLILAFQGFANRPVGHTHERVDDLCARSLEKQ